MRWSPCGETCRSCPVSAAEQSSGSLRGAWRFRRSLTVLEAAPRLLPQANNTCIHNLFVSEMLLLRGAAAVEVPPCCLLFYCKVVWIQRDCLQSPTKVYRVNLDSLDLDTVWSSNKLPGTFEIQLSTIYLLFFVFWPFSYPPSAQYSLYLASGIYCHLWNFQTVFSVVYYLKSNSRTKVDHYPTKSEHELFPPTGKTFALSDCSTVQSPGRGNLQTPLLPGVLG